MGFDLFTGSRSFLFDAVRSRTEEEEEGSVDRLKSIRYRRKEGGTIGWKEMGSPSSVSFGPSPSAPGGERERAPPPSGGGHPRPSTCKDSEMTETILRSLMK